MKRSLAQEQERCIDIIRGRGDFICGEDGYYVYWPGGDRQGAYAAHHLRWIADELDKMNSLWDAEVHRFFNKAGGGT